MSNITVSGPQDTLLAQANIKKVFMNVDNRFVQVPIGTALEGVASSALANKADLIGGKLDPAQLPDLAIAQYLGEVANQAAMLALVGQSGDWCSRTDTGMVYVVTGNSSVVSGWTQLKYPASAVQSVCGLSGTITLAQLASALSTSFASTAQGTKADNAMPNTIDAVQAVLDAAKNGDATAKAKLVAFQSSTSGDRQRLLGGRYEVRDLKPVHLPIILGDQHIGMTPVVSGNGTLDVNTSGTTGEYCTSSLRMVVTTPFASGFTITPPAMTQAGLTGQTIKAGGVIAVRIKVSDWSQVNSMIMRIIPVGGNVSNCYTGTLVDSASKSTYGNKNPANATAWNNVWRTIHIPSSLFATLGAPPLQWGRNAESVNISSVYFGFTATANVTVEINRIYSPQWPVGFVAHHLDGCYPAALAATRSYFEPLGWKFSGSMSSVEYDPQFPTLAQILAAHNAGHDIYNHISDITVGNVVAGFTSATTAAAVLKSSQNQRRSLMLAGIRNPNASRWCSVLGNIGQAATDFASLLKAMGISGARGKCVDAEFGIDPFNSTYINTVSDTVGRGGWISDRGRYNRPGTPLHASPVAMTAADLDNWTNVNCQSRMDLEYAALTRSGVHTWNHEVKLLANLINGDVNVGTNFYQSFLDNMKALIDAGSVIPLTISQVNMLTYDRPGEEYVRWDGEWVRRDNPTQISF